MCVSAILLGSLRVPHVDMKRWILEIDENRLNEGMIQSLLNNLPEPEQINSVFALKEEYDDMAEAEQFCVTVSHYFNLLYCLLQILTYWKGALAITYIDEGGSMVPHKEITFESFFLCSVV